MDQFMADLTGIPEAKEGDSVTLVGRDGNQEITMEELAEISEKNIAEIYEIYDLVAQDNAEFSEQFFEAVREEWKRSGRHDVQG